MSQYQRLDSLPSHVFRAYDIRGRVDEELNDDSFYTLGLALGSLMVEAGHQEAVVGFDGRLSSPRLGLAMSEGLMSCGLRVNCVGLVPSPLLYFATQSLQTGAGVMITGSHNGKGYNGVKPVVSGKNLTGEAIQALAKRIAEKNYVSGQGSFVESDIVQTYMSEVEQDINMQRPMKIAIDCGNGAAGFFVAELFRRVGVQVTELYCEVDGNFPNHHPDPAVDDNLRDLQAVVVDNDLDAGLAFDGDADRIGLVDNLGQIIRPDRLLMLLATQVLAKEPAANIVYDVKCSRVLGQLIEKLGGQAHMCPTGHSIIKQKMAEVNAKLAGEMSGHLFLKDRWNGFDDAVYAGLRLLETLSEQPLCSAEVFSQYDSGFSTPELKIPVSEDAKFDLMRKIREEIDFSPAACLYLDGVRCELPDSWGLIRASNTTPYLVMRFEGETKEALSHIQTWFKSKLESLNQELNLPF